MLAAREKLCPLLKLMKSGSGSTWRDDLNNFHSEGAGPQGVVNLSPGWFQKGHDVSDRFGTYNLVLGSLF
jgi:hypothetical protein